MNPHNRVRRWAARGLGIAGTALITASVLPLAVFAEPATAQSTAPVDGVELTGTGAWSVTNFMQVYSASFYDSAAPTLLSYIPKGDRDGRRIFANGDADFVVSGRPLTEDDTALLDARKTEVITAPFSVGSAAFFLSGPFQTGLEVYIPDPDPEANGTRVPYTGTLRMPNSTLATIFLDRGGRNNWYDGPFAAANAELLPEGASFAPVISPTIPVVRSDPSAENYYLQRFVAHTDPENYLAKVAESKLEAFEIGENWPFLETASRTGSVAVANLVAGGQNPKEGIVPFGGVIASAPTSDALIQKANFPDAQVFVAAIQNGAGEWVQPTPEAINAAIDFGADDVDMPGLVDPVPGAYPMVWVNHISVPAKGLSIDKTNAVASLMRVGALTSRSVGAAIGEGGLSSPLVLEALTAADRVVESNCAAAGGTVTTAANGGSAWPEEVAAPPAPVKVCRSAGNGSTSTSTTLATTAEAATSDVLAAGRPGGFSGIGSGGVGGPNIGSSGGYASSYSGSFDAYDVPSAVDSLGVVAADVALDTTGSEAPSPVALASVDLPLEPPDDGRGHLDRFSTLLLGTVVTLIARSIARSAGVAL